MKKLIALMSLSLICGCERIELPVEEYVDSAAPEFYGVFEDFDQTRTQLDSYNNIRWESGDRILIFNGSTLADIYQVQDDGVGETSAGFDYVECVSEGFASGSDINHNIAFYPLNARVKCAKADNLENTNAYELTNVIIQDIQEYQDNSFASGSFPMVAVTQSVKDNKLIFKNICGGLKLQLSGDCCVRDIAITGNDDEIIAGEATVSAYVDRSSPMIEMEPAGSTSVTLDCGEAGVQLSPDVLTNFILTLPPVCFSKGFSVLVTDTDGRIAILKTSNPQQIYRSSLLRMPEVTLNSAEMSIFKVDDTSHRIISCKGGKLSINVTAVNAEYEVVLSEQDWLSSVEDNEGNHPGILEFEINGNDTDEDRNATITILCQKYNLSYEIPVTQLKYADLIDFKDQEVKSVCVSNFDTDGDKELSLEEAKMVTGFADAFTNISNICSFDEIRYFTSVTELNENIFKNCTGLTSFTVPDFITHIKKSAFAGCTSLKSIKIGACVSSIETGAFEPASLREIIVDEDNATYDSRENCNAIVETSADNIIVGCINSTILEGIKGISERAFYGSGMMKIVLPSTIEHIGELAFSGYSGNKDVFCSAPVPPVLDCDSYFTSWHSFHTGNFMFSYQTYAYILEEYIDVYTASWGQYSTITLGVKTE